MNKGGSEVGKTSSRYLQVSISDTGVMLRQLSLVF